MLEITNIQQDEINILIAEYLQTTEGQKILEQYYIEKFKDDYAEQLEEILDNEELIRTMEKVIDDLEQRLEDKKYDEFRNDYIKRNSLEKIKESLNEELNESPKDVYQEVTKLNKNEEKAIETFSDVKKIQNIIDTMNNKKCSLDESLSIVFQNDRYTLSQIQRGIDSLNEDKGILGNLNKHLY